MSREKTEKKTKDKYSTFGAERISADYPPQDILDIAEEYGIYTRFAKKTLLEADGIPQKVEPESLTGREDLRGLTTVTIDGEGTKDFDDAVSLSRTPEGLWEVGVHIADVAQYVREGSPLDREALRRGTSFYPAGCVIPMLPEALSNGICSLKAGEDRLALSCLITLTPEGKPKDYRICESVIHVDARLTYEGVMRLMESGDESEIEASLSTQGYRGIRGRTRAIAVMLRRLMRISQKLKAARMERGCLDFDFPESDIRLDEAGRPVSISARRRNDATEMIEDLMILANETVARHCCERDIPIVYRVHGRPDRDKILELETVLRRYGYSLPTAGGKVQPRDIAALIRSCEGTPEEAAVSRLILRSMQRAVYDTHCDGHFGLALAHYCHFTSPIRRYPDLLVHRSLKEWLHGEMTPERRQALQVSLPDKAMLSSQREQIAMEAEREAAKLKKAEYMSDRIGEIYDGVVSGVTSFGIFAELPNTVEGMIFVGDLNDDYYYFDERQLILEGEFTGKRYRLGDPVRIAVKSADTERRLVDFVPAEQAESVLNTAAAGERRQKDDVRAGGKDGEKDGGQKAGKAARHGGKARQIKKKARGKMDRTGRALAAGGGRGGRGRHKKAARRAGSGAGVIKRGKRR